MNGYLTSAARPAGYGTLAFGLLLAAYFSLLTLISGWTFTLSQFYDFWFYITVFARYPRDIYLGSTSGMMLYSVFSYVIPILLVVTVPAQVVTSQLLHPSWLMAITLTAAVGGLVLARVVFQAALRSYRSASS